MIILAVVLAIAFFNIGNLTTRLTAAENNMQNIANNTYHNDDSDDDLDSTSYKILNYVDYKVLNIDKSKPWLATISITYSPEKYSKNLKVTFNAPQEDGTIKEAEKNVQKITDKYIETIDAVGADKDKEIMSI